MILFGESGVRHACEQYLAYYLRERVHSALGRRIIPSQEPLTSQEISSDSMAGLAVVANAVATVPDAAIVPGSAMSGLAAPPVSPPKSRWDSPATIDEVRCRERLGGLLKSYYRQAA